jgi:hypothetical protein
LSGFIELTPISTIESEPSESAQADDGGVGDLPPPSNPPRRSPPRRRSLPCPIRLISSGTFWASPSERARSHSRPRPFCPGRPWRRASRSARRPPC